MIIQAVLPGTDSVDTCSDDETDTDTDIEDVQPTCKTVMDCLMTTIKFFEMESQTTESDIDKLFYYKRKVEQIKTSRAKQVTVADFLKKE